MRSRALLRRCFALRALLGLAAGREGGVTQGLGYALTEERIVDAASGVVLNANLEDYKVQSAADLPEIVDATESVADWEANETGAKGIGEPPIIPTAAAVANAIFDATGVRVRDLPCKRETFLLYRA